MKTIDRIRDLNPDKTIYSTRDAAFESYGRVLDRCSASDILSAAREAFGNPDTDQTNYIASSPVLENTSGFLDLKNDFFGEMEIQAGCCYGFNTRMNGMEYHKSSEIIGAATQCLLMLGKVQDVVVEDGNEYWDSEKVEYFYLGNSEWLELYSTSLHLAPCRIDEEPFAAIIVLPQGTNTPLAGDPVGSLWMQNKWMLACQDSLAAGRGAHVGIRGLNHEVKTL